MDFKRYIICINECTAAESKAFSLYLKQSNFNWWHWIDNVWLVVDEHGVFSASEFRDTLPDYFGEKRCLVIELNDKGHTWAGRGPTSPEKNMFTWLKTTWKKKKLNL